MALKIGFKQRICHIGPNLKLLETVFLELDISTAEYPKYFLYGVCRANSHLLFIYIFWYLLVLYVNFSVKPLNFAPKLSISYIQPILVAIFVTISTVNVKVI